MSISPSGAHGRSYAVAHVHRLHHVHWQGEGDVNFGLFFTLWDRLLGTYQNEPTRAPAAGDIGVQDFPDFPQDYVAQVLLPFATGRRARLCGRAPQSEPRRLARERDAGFFSSRLAR